MKRILFLAPLALTASALAQSTVVDLQFTDGLAANVPVREATTSTPSEFLIEWSDSALLFDNTSKRSTGQNKSLYGGVKMTSRSAAFRPAEPPLVRITDIEDGAFDHIAIVGNTGDVEDVQTLHYVFLWGADDFLTDAKRFNSAENSITASARGIIAPSNAQSRFVIRDGTTYYISNLPGPQKSGETVTINANAADLEWAPFDPAGFVDFTGEGADLGLPNFSPGEYQARTFENVTGVGIIGYNDREWNAGVLFWLNEFRAVLAE